MWNRRLCLEDAAPKLFCDALSWFEMDVEVFDCPVVWEAGWCESVMNPCVVRRHLQAAVGRQAKSAKLAGRRGTEGLGGSC